MNAGLIHARTMEFVLMASTITSATVRQDITVQTATKVRLYRTYSPYCVIHWRQDKMLSKSTFISVMKQKPASLFCKLLFALARFYYKLVCDHFH